MIPIFSTSALPHGHDSLKRCENCKLENAHQSREQKGSQIGKVHLKLSCQPKAPRHIQLRFRSVIAKHKPCLCASALRRQGRQLHNDSTALTTCSQNEIFSISSELPIITGHFKICVTACSELTAAWIAAKRNVMSEVFLSASIHLGL